MTPLLGRLGSRLFASRPTRRRCIRCGRSPGAVPSAPGPRVSLCADCIAALRAGEFARLAAAPEPRQGCSFCRRSGRRAGRLYRGAHGAVCGACLSFSVEALRG